MLDQAADIDFGEQTFEIRDGPGQAVLERGLRGPIEHLAGARDIRLPLPPVVGARRTVDMLERGSVRSIVILARSMMLISVGLPRLIGSVTPSAVAINATAALASIS